MIGIWGETSNKKRSIGFRTFSTTTDSLQHGGTVSMSVLHSSSPRFRNIVDRPAPLRFPFSEHGLLYASGKLSHIYLQKVSSKTPFQHEIRVVKGFVSPSTVHYAVRQHIFFLHHLELYERKFQAICFSLSQYVAHRKCGYSLCGQSYSFIKYETPKIAHISHHQLVHPSLHLSHCVSLCSSH